MRRRALAAWLVSAATAVLLLNGCRADAPARGLVPGGNPERGRRLAISYGCGACHMIPGVRNAEGTVGPPLIVWRRRAYVAGLLPNTPEYLERWIMTPQAVVPGNAMPDMGVTARDAADIAAYLYTIE